MATAEAASTGSLRKDISNAIVQVMHDYTGRGPTRARTYLSENFVAVLLQETMTTAERNLATSGEGDFVLGIRQKFQMTMRDDCVARIEELTGRKVRAFMSANHVDPDIAAELFVLEPEPSVDGLR